MNAFRLIIIFVKLDKILNKYDLHFISVPGRCNFQLHSVMISYLNEYLVQDENYHASLTKIKWSIKNVRKTQLQSLETQNECKHNEWRKHKVGDFLPSNFWMND